MTTRDRSLHAGKHLGGIRLLGSALLMLCLVACAAAPTPYREADGGFGYRDQQLESNRYRVSFAGNSATALDRVQDYALYRAAELTLASGYDYFKVVERGTDTRSSGVGGISARSGRSVGTGKATARSGTTVVPAAPPARRKVTRPS